jgi:uncharacterized protein YgfB (UPF0149 family)
MKMRTGIQIMQILVGLLQFSQDLQDKEFIFILKTCEPSSRVMDLGGLLVHYGLATMSGLGLAGVKLFGRSSRRELATG